MSTSFDTLAAAISETRSNDVTVWEHDSDIAERPELYARRFGAQGTDVELFVDLRRSATLQAAFAEKYDEEPELESFEDFAHQLVDVVLPRDENQFGSLAERVRDAVAAFLPSGTTTTPPRFDDYLDCILVEVRHPLVSGSSGNLFLAEDDSVERIQFALMCSLEFWWESLTCEEDIEDAEAAEKRLLRTWLSSEVAASHRKLVETHPGWDLAMGGAR